MKTTSLSVKQRLCAGVILLATCLSACSKESVKETAPVNRDGPVRAGITTSAASTITYTDESNFVARLSSYGF
ncbi:MAG TPA: hypothetical protein VM802_03625, partial [Chitinophaga sp.]|nr:hypothetical protein [Chitinophaga sp.]